MNSPRPSAHTRFLSALPIACALLIGPAPGFAQTGGATWMPLDGSPAGTPAEVTLDPAESGPTQTTFTLVLHGFYVTPRTAPDGAPFSELEVPGLQRLRALGAPALPVLRKSLAIVTGAGQVTLSSMTPLASPLHFGLHVWPGNAPAMDDDDTGHGTPEEFTLDPAIYASDAPYPPSQGTATGIEPALGSIPACDIECDPIHWTPATDDLEVIPVTRWTFSHDGPQLAFDVITPDRSRIARNLFLNWGSVGTWIPPSYLHYQGEYLFVYPSAFALAIKPLVKQKYLRGFNVTQITTESTGAITCASVRAAIKSWYTSTPTSYDHYCLLVGDINSIPYCGDSDPDPRSDDPYGSVSSNLLARDIFVGRLPALAAADVSAEVSKIIDYEDHPPGPLYYGGVLLVAHKVDGTTGVGDYPAQQEHVLHTSFKVNPLFVPYYGSQPGKTNAGVNTHINSGYGIVCYRGHGWKHAWTTWDLSGSCTGYSDPGECYTASNINALANGPLYPVVWSFACFNSDLSDGNCIARAWMNKSAGGAVAHYGATRGSGTLDNNVLEDTLFAAVWSKGITNIAHATTFAEDQARKWDYGAAESNAFEYALFGDPDMSIRREMPSSWQVLHPVSITISGNGQAPLDVRLLDPSNAPIQAALVSIWKPAATPAPGASRDAEVAAAGDEAADNTYTGADGFVHFAMSGLTPGMLYLAVRDSVGDSEVDSIAVVQTTDVGTSSRGAPGLWAEPSVTRGGTLLRLGRALESGGTIRILDAAGRRVTTLSLSRGASSIPWPGTSRSGEPVRSGVYFARLGTPMGELTTRIIVRR